MAGAFGERNEEYISDSLLLGGCNCSGGGGISCINNVSAGQSMSIGVKDDCCDNVKSGMERLLCKAICVLCCLTCKVCDIKCGGPELPTKPPPVEAPGGNPVFVVDGGGNIGFTRSEYGALLPLVFGADRLNGNVFWTSGFDTQTFTDTATNTEYYYTKTSFALALCEGEVDALLRLWVGEGLLVDNRAIVDDNGFPVPSPDGNIISATLDVLAPDSPLRRLPESMRQTKITMVTGTETQLVSPIMALIDGEESTPAYRGVAYILFENYVLSDGTVPAISAEVIANSNPIYPRLYGNLPSVQQYFSEPWNDQEFAQRALLMWDSGYDRFILGAFDRFGTSPLVPNGNGVVVFNANNLQLLNEWEMEKTYKIDSWMRTYTSAQALLPLTSYMLVFSADPVNVNAAWREIRTFNLTSGTVMDTYIDTTPTITTTHTDTGVRFPLSVVPFIASIDGRGPQDVCAVLGPRGSGGTGEDAGVAFISVDTNGRIRYENLVRHVVPSGMDVADTGKAHMRPYMAAADIVERNPTFEDGAATAGMHFFVFHNLTNGNTARIGVRRLTIGGGDASMDNPILTTMTGPRVDDLDGGLPMVVQRVWFDRMDGCYVLHVSRPTGQNHFMMKWSPYTGEVLWRSSVQANGVRAQINDYVMEQTYGWVASGTIWTIDLATGLVTEDSTLVSQLLPAQSASAVQFYNSSENSITYLSNDSVRRLCKVFIGRVARSDVPLADVVQQLLERVGVNPNDINVEDIQALSMVGYTIKSRTPLRTVFSELAQVFRFDLIESNGRYVYKSRGSSPIATIPHIWLSDVDERGWLLQHQDNDFARTRKINLTYRDVDREYMDNVQSVHLPKYSRESFDSDAAIDVTVPVVLDPNTAKRLAEILLYSKIIYENTYEAQLSPGYINLDPGDVITITSPQMEPLTARIRDIDIGDDQTVRLNLTQEDPDIYNDQVSLFGNAGTWIPSKLTTPNRRVDPYILPITFRTAAEARATTTQHYLYVTLLNNNPGPAHNISMKIRTEGTADITVEPLLTFPTWGVTVTSLPYTPALYSIDPDTTVDIAMISTSGAPLGDAASTAAMINNSNINLAVIGQELIQFGKVTSLGGNRVRLHNIVRARNGTEAGAYNHINGEKFVLLGDYDGDIDVDSVRQVPLQPTTGGRRVVQLFVDSNNPFQPSPIGSWVAMNLSPWSVTGFDYQWNNDDDLTLTWQRRARFDAPWVDGYEDVPLTEASELYEVWLTLDLYLFEPDDPLTYLRTAQLTTNTLTYDIADQIAEGYDNTQDTLYVVIRTRGELVTGDGGAMLSYRVFPK